MYRLCHVNCISSQTPGWTRIFPPYIIMLGNQKLDTVLWKHIYQQHVETRLKSLHRLPTSYTGKDTQRRQVEECFRLDYIEESEYTRTHFWWGWQLCWNGKVGETRRDEMFVLQETHGLCVCVHACKESCVFVSVHHMFSSPNTYKPVKCV